MLSNGLNEEIKSQWNIRGLQAGYVNPRQTDEFKKFLKMQEFIIDSMNKIDLNISLSSYVINLYSGFPLRKKKLIKIKPAVFFIKILQYIGTR